MSATTIGILVALVASFSWAVGSVLVRLGINRMGSSTATFLSVLSGFLFVLLIGLVVDAGAFLDLSLAAAAGFVIVGLLSFMGGRYLYYTSVSMIGVGRATAMGGATPIVASLLAVLFLGEQLTLPLALGIFAVVGGVALIVSGPDQQQ